MALANSVLHTNDDFPIKTELPVHSGKVRSVYWLSDADSRRLIEQKNYPVPASTPLAIMIISDRISAFDCIWHGENDLKGIPGKGAALNAVSNHWFSLFKASGLANSHIVDIPHPFVWIVQKARPIKIEAICRQYITGSMWRAYQQGEREFCGIQLPDGLSANQKLDNLLITPSTKGILKGIPGVPEADDVNITRSDIVNNYAAFNFNSIEDVDRYETCLTEGFRLINNNLAALDQIFVDTKFEFGYVADAEGNDQLIYMDEVGTPDSSRIWDGAEFRNGRIVENSKEGFRQSLLNFFPDPDILLNKTRMKERSQLAKDNALPLEFMMDLSKTYLSIAEKIVGHPIRLAENPKQEILDVLNNDFQLVR
ncbi:MAG: phosphoribosylaminoimidazolesuccinocarboxamide synthase [Gammaproteobacteria bacterium]|nr:phosphoribosylaminoimidazolesuccinocarboxamide synthase [Gammaproteobacteria bacterium]